MKRQGVALILVILLLALCACGASEGTTDTPRIAALTGPTAISMAYLLENSDQLYGTPDELTPRLLMGEVDIASVPINLASVLYHKTEGGIRLLAVNVLGVLYIAEYGSEDIHSFADLRGKTLYATGKGGVPESYLRRALRENGLDPDKDVRLEWKSEPGEIVGLLAAEGQGIAMLPQPYVAAAKDKLGEGFRSALSVSDAIGTGCVTAGIVVREEYAEAHPEAIETFLAAYADSAEKVNGDPERTGVLCDGLMIANAAVVTAAIPDCHIVSLTGAEMKSTAENALGILVEENAAIVGGTLPGEDFYYGA